MALGDFSLEISDIRGEMSNGRMRIQSFSVDSSQGNLMAEMQASGTPLAGGKARMADIVITRESDSASPRLMQACAEGRHLDTVSIIGVRASGKGAGLEFLHWNLEQVLISSYAQVLSDDPEENASRPREMISLNFAVLQMEYNPQEKWGDNTPWVQGKYDLKASDSK
jgi:type VI secretion system secreted protein Hcp